MIRIDSPRSNLGNFMKKGQKSEEMCICFLSLTTWLPYVALDTLSRPSSPDMTSSITSQNKPIFFKKLTVTIVLQW